MNHVNFFDPFLSTRLPGIARGAEEESHFRWPVYGGAIRRMGCSPSTARTRSGDRKPAPGRVLDPREAGLFLRHHARGHADPRRPALPFKRGGFVMALETGLDILPVVQKGAYAIAHKGSLMIRPGRVEVSIEPSDPRRPAPRGRTWASSSSASAASSSNVSGNRSPDRRRSGLRPART